MGSFPETEIDPDFLGEAKAIRSSANIALVDLHLFRSHGDRLGATDLATLSLHLILFSASFRATQNFNPVHSEILFSQRKHDY